MFKGKKDKKKRGWKNYTCPKISLVLTIHKDYFSCDLFINKIASDASLVKHLTLVRVCIKVPLLCNLPSPSWGKEKCTCDNGELSLSLVREEIRYILISITCLFYCLLTIL